jgi:hypothetical protein
MAAQRWPVAHPSRLRRARAARGDPDGGPGRQGMPFAGGRLASVGATVTHACCFGR